MSAFLKQWFPPKGAKSFFYHESDINFKTKHPVGYVFLVLLGIAVMLLPQVLYLVYVLQKYPKPAAWIVLGYCGSLVIGIGLFNLVAVIIKQYLGHLVTILSFLIGAVMIAVSLHFLG